MTDHFEKPEFLARSHEKGTCIGVRQVDGRDPGEYAGCGLVGFDRREVVECCLGQDDHCSEVAAGLVEEEEAVAAPAVVLPIFSDSDGEGD